MTTDDMLITDERVAELFGITRQTVWKWAKLGRIPAPVVNRIRYARWSNNDVQAHIEKMKRGELQEAAS